MRFVASVFVAATAFVVAVPASAATFVLDFTVVSSTIDGLEAGDVLSLYADIPGVITAPGSTTTSYRYGFGSIRFYSNGFSRTFDNGLYDEYASVTGFTETFFGDGISRNNGVAIRIVPGVERSYVARFNGQGAQLAVGIVPEPGTWATMIGGFGLVGAALRRRAQMLAA